MAINAFTTVREAGSVRHYTCPFGHITSFLHMGRQVKRNGELAHCYICHSDYPVGEPVNHEMIEYSTVTVEEEDHVHRYVCPKGHVTSLHLFPNVSEPHQRRYLCHFCCKEYPVWGPGLKGATEIRELEENLRESIQRLIGLLVYDRVAEEALGQIEELVKVSRQLRQTCERL